MNEQENNELFEVNTNDNETNVNEKTSAGDIEVMDGAFFEKEQSQPVENEEVVEIIEVDDVEDNSDFVYEPKIEVEPLKKTSFFKKHQKAVLLVGCFALGLAGSVCGSLLTGGFPSGSKSVMYQSVETPNVEVSDVKTVAKNCSPSVVEIQTESVSTHSFFSNAISSGAGSGVILSKDGYIVTNHHVIEGANKVSVTTSDGKSYNAKLVGSDQSSDLAVIKIDADDLTPAIQGTSSKLEVGDSAIAIGNPLGELGGTVTNGIISALDREVTIDNQTMHLLQTNAAINPGNSGGGLFNAKGELIGIVNAKSSGENIEGLGFAIPIDRAKPIIENLIKNGYVKDRASLGVSLSYSQNPFDQSETIYISDLVKGGAAEKAGLKAGDQILKIDDVDITSVSQLKDIISSHKAGEKIVVTVLRSNRIEEVNVTLQESSDETQSASTQNQNQDPSSGIPYDPFGDGFDIEDFFNYFGN